MAQLVIEEIDVDTAPATPGDGSVFGISQTPDGDWATRPGQIAIWMNGGWEYLVPRAGWHGYVKSAGDVFVHDGTAWFPQGASSISSVPELGIGTSADATNRLSVSSPASLFSHSGDDHRMVLNKASAAATTSLLFQSDWSGRAEIGLTGSEDLQVKVSPDGSSFNDAVRIDAASGVFDLRAAQSGQVSVGSDAVANVSLPITAGFVLLARVDGAAAATDHGGIFVFSDGPSPSLQLLLGGSTLVAHGTGPLTGTTGGAGETGIALIGGSLVLENRSSGTARYSYTFIGGN